MIRISASDLEKKRARPYAAPFSASVRKGPGCWEWTASRQKFGYGTKWHNGSVQLAHRIAWEEANGPIQEGMCVLHRCDNPKCVRPDHLFLGTVADNNADRHAKGRDGGGLAARAQTHCKRGHEYTPENTCRYGKTGRRSCRACRLAAWTAWKARRGGGS